MIILPFVCFDMYTHTGTECSVSAEPPTNTAEEDCKDERAVEREAAWQAGHSDTFMVKITTCYNIIRPSHHFYPLALFSIEYE